MLGVFLGFILGVLASFAFYLLARADAELSNRRAQMFQAILRLKLMTPTSRERVVGGFGLSETENYLTCIAEVLCLGRWEEGAVAILRVVTDMKNLQHYPKPDESQRAEREAKKEEWQAHLFQQIEELEKWHAGPRTALLMWSAK